LKKKKPARRPGATVERVPPKQRMPSLGERLERRNLVVQFMLSGLTFDQMARQLADRGVSTEAARRVYDEVIAEMRNGQDELIRNARIETIHRLRRDLAALRNPKQARDKDGKLVFDEQKDARGRVIGLVPRAEPIDFARVVAHETLLAKIEGTLEPVKIQVDAEMITRRSILTVVANLTAEKLDELALEDEELERKALGNGKG
jgi:hypothetical protein